MAFVYEDTLNCQSGQLVIADNVWDIAKNVLITNLEQEPGTSRFWAIYLIKIYVPNPTDQFATIYTKKLYTDWELLFNPFPNLAGLNVQTGIYVPRTLFTTDVEIYLE